MPSPPSGADDAASRSRCRLPLSTTAATDAAAAAAAGRYHCRLCPLTPLVTATAAIDFRLCRPPPPSAVRSVAASRRPLQPRPAIVNPWPPFPPQYVVEALWNGATLAKLAAILAAHSRTVHEYRTDCTPEERSGQVIQSFLAQLASGVDGFPGLERVTVVVLDPGGRVLLVHSLFYVRFNVYSTQRRLFACLGELSS